MSGLSEFLHMGGYAVYVWSSYGIVAVVLAANVIATVARARAVRRRVERELGNEAPRPATTAVVRRSTGGSIT